MKRKTICWITAIPESIHGVRVKKGIFSQCDKYGYNVAVFASMTHLESGEKGYREGEVNIYELINYDLIDGIIIDATPLTEDKTGDTRQRILKRLEKCGKPVVVLDMPFGEHPVIRSTSEPILRGMCRHITEVHGCRDITLMTGPKGHEIAEDRLRIFLDELGKSGVEVSEDQIEYGDFWYTSGENLARDMLEGKKHMPEALICASDHMALGVIEILSENGVKIPDDLIVLGFEATDEAAMNDITLSSFESNDTKTAADAVDALRRIIDPGEEIIPYETDIHKVFHAGMSCGCMTDVARSMKSFKSALYYTTRNYNYDVMMNSIDIGLLMESYVSENFVAAQTPEDCLAKIYYSTYLLFPYQNYFLCLKENWLDTDHDIIRGYPKKMKTVLANTAYAGGPSFYDDKYSQVFDTKLMLPMMWEDTEEPMAFYFTAVHFNEIMLGYSVLQRKLSDSHNINLVYRNWVRFVNIALEMIRAKNRLLTLSIRDEMTGFYNRRGLYISIEKLVADSTEGKKLYVYVVDMDGLKYINDNFGHSEGDEGIKNVARALQAIADIRDICVRAGGDEFYLIGKGSCTEEDIRRGCQRFKDNLSALNETAGKPYEISASIGCAFSENITVEEVGLLLQRADEEMYENKVKSKRARQ